MNVLIVHAHEEPKSFNGAMKDTAVTVLSKLSLRELCQLEPVLYRAVI